ncbi:unnamed protein product [Rhizophagus irregularis]|nr:unnamed protein product [Rhizophagus irregularis]
MNLNEDLADSKHVNELWKSPEILKNVYEEPNKEPEKENRKKKEKYIKISMIRRKPRMYSSRKRYEKLLD